MVDVATARIVLGSEVECEANCGQEQLDLLRCGTFVPDTHTHTLAALALSSALFDLPPFQGFVWQAFPPGHSSFAWTRQLVVESHLKFWFHCQVLQEPIY